VNTSLEDPMVHDAIFLRSKSHPTHQEITEADDVVRF
jgi:hypothetical protein